MVMRITPYSHIRYPWASDVVNPADVQSMGADIDQALVQTANLANDFSRFPTVVAKRVAAQSLTKGSLTAITFDNVIDNGANSPVSNGAWWSAGTPTRLTAPLACVVMAIGTGGVNSTSAWGSPAAIQITVALNGASTTPGVQGAKYSPISTQIGQEWQSAMTLWNLAKGDYLELKMYWTGTPAGPFNTDTAIIPTLSLAMVALPSVP
jgi:hypothetical protein